MAAFDFQQVEARRLTELNTIDRSLLDQIVQKYNLPPSSRIYAALIDACQVGIKSHEHQADRRQT